MEKKIILALLFLSVILLGCTPISPLKDIYATNHPSKGFENALEKYHQLILEFNVSPSYVGAQVMQCNNQKTTIYVVTANDKFSGKFVFFDYEGVLLQEYYYNDIITGNEKAPIVDLRNYICSKLKTQAIRGEPRSLPPIQS